MTPEKKQRKLRVMFCSNSPTANSGYSIQMQELLPFIRDEGFPVGMVAFYGYEGGNPAEFVGYEGIKMYPRMGDVWGSDGMIAHGQDFKADVMFSLQDAWVLDTNNLKKIRNYIPIVPIDHDPVPAIILEKLRQAYRIVTYSKFGYNELKRVGLNSTYIPHTVNTEIFKPMDQGVIRDKLGLPRDAYIFGMVAANKDNPPRKSFQEAMDAFKEFLNKRPNALMYFHVQVEQAGGFPILSYARFLGIEKQVFFTPLYPMLYHMDKKDMAEIYNSFDCLLMPSTSEGFGIPTIEAQACGKPVIVNDFTALPELVLSGKTGEHCRVLHKRWDNLMSYVGVPDPRHLFDLMERVYRYDKKEVEESCVSFIKENYDTKKVFYDKWLPYLNMLENEVYLPEVDKAKVAS